MVSLRILSMALCLSLMCGLSSCSPAPRHASHHSRPHGHRYPGREIETILDEIEERFEKASDSGAVGEGLGIEVKREEKSEVKMAVATQLDQAQIAAILKQHNDERSALNANNLLAMTWDDDLARLAQGLSDGCKWGHANMVLPDGKKTGQNIAMWSNVNKPLGDLAQMWIDEKYDYDLASGKCKPGRVCGHYTQIVWHNSDKVGCGATKCPGWGVFLVCDYLGPGNWYGKKPVGLGGAPCSKCNLYPGTSCNQGLCSVCQPGSDGCTEYDPSTCVDGAPEKCSWAYKYCDRPRYRMWLEGICAKTCKFCHS